MELYPNRAHIFFFFNALTSVRIKILLLFTTVYNRIANVFKDNTARDKAYGVRFEQILVGIRYLNRNFFEKIINSDVYCKFSESLDP